MKRIILSVMVMAFAIAAQASDAKTPQDKAKDTDKPSCCGSKVQTSNDSKGTCPFAKAACCKDKEVKQTVLASPKAASDTAK